MYVCICTYWLFLMISLLWQTLVPSVWQEPQYPYLFCFKHPLAQEKEKWPIKYVTVIRCSSQVSFFDITVDKYTCCQFFSFSIYFKWQRTDVKSNSSILELWVEDQENKKTLGCRFKLCNNYKHFYG